MHKAHLISLFLHILQTVFEGCVINGKEGGLGLCLFKVVYANLLSVDNCGEIDSLHIILLSFQIKDF